MRKATSFALMIFLLGLLATACSAQVTTSIETHFTTGLPNGVYFPAPASVHSQSLSDLYCINSTGANVDIQLFLGATTTGTNMQNVVVVNKTGIKSSLVMTVAPRRVEQAAAGVDAGIKSRLVMTVAPNDSRDLFLFVDYTTSLAANTYGFTDSADGFESKVPVANKNSTVSMMVTVH